MQLAMALLAWMAAPLGAQQAPPPPEASGQAPEEQLPTPEDFAPEPLGDTPPPLEEPEAPPVVAEEVDPVQMHALEARAIMRLALALTSLGHWEEARGHLVLLTTDYDDTPEGEQAHEHLRTLDLVTADGPKPYQAFPTPGGGFEIRDPDSGEVVTLEQKERVKRERSGAAELAIGQAVVGAGLLGVALPVAVDGVDPVIMFMGVQAGGAGGAVTAALMARRYPLTPGQASAITTAELLGGWNGAVLAAGIWGEEDWQLAAAAAGGTLLGGAAGIQAAIHGQPDAGQVALVAQGGLWGLGLGGLSFLVVEGDDPRQNLIRLGVATDLGAVAGAALASRHQPSRKRVTLVSLTGCVGLGFGAAAQAVARNTGTDSDELTAGLLAASSLGGLGLGTWLTRSVDLSDDGDTTQLGRPGPWIGRTQDGAPVVGVALTGGSF